MPAPNRNSTGTAVPLVPASTVVAFCLITTYNYTILPSLHATSRPQSKEIYLRHRPTNIAALICITSNCDFLYLGFVTVVFLPNKDL